MQYDASVSAMWREYLRSLGEDPETTGKVFTAWHFSDNEEAANELAALVVAGRKRATASSYWVYEHDGEPLPRDGDYSVIVNWAGQAQCIIRTTQIDVLAYDQVTAEFARTEGEGDGSLDYWLRVHWDALGRELRAVGREPHPKMPVVCEEFTVVYGPAAAGGGKTGDGIDHRSTTHGEVLVAIMSNQLDFAILRERLWYRIPTSSVERWLKHRWPPAWIAFYQTKAFGDEQHAVNYFARVVAIRTAMRWELFPDEPRDERSQRSYYQVFVQSLERLPRPIISRRRRRIVFIPTTWDKFARAVEINDLSDESGLEDRLWEEFKRLGIPAERQEHVTARRHNYILDFAIYCEMGQLDVETDGDTWHANPSKAVLDNLRDNDLRTGGWDVLRFSSWHIKEQALEYCVRTVVENVNKLGGPAEDRIIPRRIDLDAQSGTYQLSMFDDLRSEVDP